MNTLRTLLATCLLLALTMAADAKKKYPDIKFDKVTLDLGTFSQDQPIQTCEVRFRNVGQAKLVINSVATSCGCTVADYPKDFISPGGEGKIVVTYDGTGKMPGKFKRIIRVFSNCKQDTHKIELIGEMTAMPAN